MISTWKDFFANLKETEYGPKLQEFLIDEYSHYTCYPPRNLMFQAFKECPIEKTKVVIIGQDPYHNPGQAMGLSFSVPTGIECPPSLKNIFKELSNEGFHVNDPSDGDLTPWARQGVLLLNAYLSVRAGCPGSHQNVLYDAFMKDVFEILDDIDRPVVFLFWGGFARKFAKYCHNEKHLVLFANHPSPLSANRGGWFGCDHFQKTNAFLLAHGQIPIDWGR